MAGSRRASPLAHRIRQLESAEHVVVRNRPDLKRFIRLPAKLFAADPMLRAPDGAGAAAKRSHRTAIPASSMPRRSCFSRVRDGRDCWPHQRAVEPARARFHDGALRAAGRARTILPCSPRCSTRPNPGCVSAVVRSCRDRSAFPSTRRARPADQGFQYATHALHGARLPPTPASACEALGYTKARDLIAYLYDMRHELPVAARRLLGRKGSLLRVRSSTCTTGSAEFELVSAIFNEAWSGQWGFEPFTAGRAWAHGPVARKLLLARTDCHR